MRSSIQRLDVGLAHAELDLLVEQVHHRHRVELAAVDAADRDRAAAADGVDRGVQDAHAVDAGLLDHLPGDRVGQQAGHLLGQLADRRAVGLHADRVDHRVGAAAVGELAQRVADVVDVVECRRVSMPWRSRQREPLGHESMPITSSAPRCLAIRADIWPIGPRPNTATLPPSGIAGVLDRLPCGRQHVGEVDEALVGRALGDLDRAELRLRDAQELGLAARDLPVELGVAEAARRPCRTRGPGSSRTASSRSWSHIQQCPQEMLNGITTRSPALMWLTSAPTSSTMPIGSWPRMSPSSMNAPEHLVEVQVGAADAASW